MSFLTISVPIRAELELKKSRFIADALAIESELEAKEHLRQIEREFPDATHHCWAYVIGDPKNSTSMKAEDDGEPSGTAGKPILNVLLRKNIGNTQVVVTRYYGGTKLGASGLVRAYSNATTLVLDPSGLVPHLKRFRARIAYPYEVDAKVRRGLSSLGLEILDSDYGSEVVTIVQGQEDLWVVLASELSELTNGRARAERLES